MPKSGHLSPVSLKATRNYYFLKVDYFATVESTVAAGVSTGVAVVSAGATVSTGSEPATLTILLPANTLLTDTIATAAITANTKLFHNSFVF